jgi:hypothetical protein
MDDMSRGICSAVATLGVLPVIRCPAGGPAEMVARKVCKSVHALYEQQQGAATSFFESGAGVLEQRPMLLIVDRSIDMAGPLVHTSTYQTLLYDLLKVGLNRVAIPAEEKSESNPSPSETMVVLDTEQDAFWAENAHALFPTAIERHKAALDEVAAQIAAMRQRTGGQTGGAQGGDTSMLLNAVNSLPQLLERQKQLERHSQVLRAIMAVVKKRLVHKYAAPEEEMLFSKYAVKKGVFELASDTALKLQDKVRLWVVYVLGTNPSQEDADEVESALTANSAAEPELSPSERDKLLAVIRYAKKILSLSRFGNRNGTESPPRQAGAAANLWDLANLTQKAFENASRQVKSIVGESKVMAAVNMMHLACKPVSTDSQIAEQDSQLLYLDPKASGTDTVPANSRIRSGFNRGVLFVVGGGCVLEYQNLMDLAHGKHSMSASLRGSAGGPGKKDLQFLYGCSELVSPDKFMDQWSECA